MQGLEIVEVVPGSIAEELDIEPGDRLVAINGHELRDVIDYNYHASDDFLLLVIARQDGETWEIEVEREEGEPLGLVFAPPVPRQCGNKCVFCFVHQLPKGLRSPLYVKDEDHRLSFLYGNYVTLSNVTAEELARIKEQRLSPLYISVHATDPMLRERMLGKKNIPTIMDQLRELADARITMHTQIVLCPGWNDGDALERTVSDLAGLHPWVASLAVVPVGITAYRKGLPRLDLVTSAYAASFLNEWQPKAQELSERLGEPFLFLADEFFIKSDTPFPPLEEYGDLPQIENGVGMIPLFLTQAEDVLDEAVPARPVKITVITGESPYRYLSEFLFALSRKTGADLHPVAVKSLLFGGGVTVTGLIAGSDIVEALKGKQVGESVLVPDVMLKEGEGVFLDDMTLADLEQALGTPVVVVESTPAGIYSALLELAEKK
ncbi:MAG: DUF512 domain-containing protein [Geobacter sp.]|nr:DUF512 domain-containing protein [Geobacter sp.]